MKAEWGKQWTDILPVQEKLVLSFRYKKNPSQEDIEMLVYLDHHDIPFKIILLKWIRFQIMKI